MTIRPYTPADDESIIQLLRLNTPEYFAPEEEQDLRDYLANHIDRYFVVEDNSNIIGSGGINITNKGKNAGLSWDIIHPDYQGKGVGSQLTQHRLDVIRTIEGIKNISVRTSQLVYKFYEKFGFVLQEVVKDYWADGIDMYRMVMQTNNNLSLEELYNHLTKTDSKRFGFRDGYIFSHIIKKIRFELFIDPRKIGLKYPIKNISEIKIDYLTKLIQNIDPNFIYRQYNTTPKNKYSIWELDIKNLSTQDISILLISIENDLL